MASIVKIRSTNSEPFDLLSITIHMPTEREHDYHNPEPDGYGQHNPEQKTTDEPSARLQFLDKAEWGIAIFIIIGVVALAIIGMICLLF